MAEGRKVLVIIEATQDQHLALERAVITSEIKEPGSHVHLFISVDNENTKQIDEDKSKEVKEKISKALQYIYENL